MRNLRCLRYFAVLCFGLLFLPAVALGQVKATITGTVTDPSGAVMPGVKITVTNTDTCLLYTSPSPRDRTRSRMPSSA